MSERMVRANGIDIFTESFGQPGDPPILLVMGAGGQGLLWADGFCERLAAGGRFCIRYDHRDTGHSTCFDFAGGHPAAAPARAHRQADGAGAEGAADARPESDSPTGSGLSYGGTPAARPAEGLRCRG